MIFIFVTPPVLISPAVMGGVLLDSYGQILELRCLESRQLLGKAVNIIGLVFTVDIFCLPPSVL
jgi:hypothetical protein